MAETVEFFGGQYLMAERIGLMPLMRFAKYARSGVDSADMAGLAAMHDLLEQCIDPTDWQRFSDAADSNRADGDQLLAVVSEVIERLTDRPTGRPSDSSAGPRTIEPNSTAPSSSPVIQRLQGRPDLQVFVLDAQEARAAS